MAPGMPSAGCVAPANHRAQANRRVALNQNARPNDRMRLDVQTAAALVFLSAPRNGLYVVCNNSCARCELG